jgi:nucleotide-binding universal stress UspA family protein
MHILVASDLTARSDWAVQRACMLASEHGCRLTVAHVVDPGLPDTLRDHTIEWAERSLRAEVARHGLDTGKGTTFRIETGSPGTAVPELAADLDADLVVLGIHDTQSPAARPFSQATAGRLVESTPKPVLVVAAEPGDSYRKVLVGVDFSLFSLSAIRQARFFAPQAEQVLVHAYHVPYRGLIRDDDNQDSAAYGERLQLDAFLSSEMESLESRARRAAPPPTAMRSLVLEGQPASVIRSTCSREGADLLALGTHGRATLSRAIWGSVALELLGDPPCDLLIVGMPGREQ